MGKNKSITIGYKYYMGIQMALCYGPIDQLQRIVAGDRDAWTGAVSASTTTSINNPNLFGGEKKEGGIQGTLYVCMGEPSQAKNPYLVTQLGPNIPAYRGVLSIVFNGMISAMNPYVKPWAFQVKRILQGWYGGTAWYSAKAAIGSDMNPAHIIYQCLTDPEWGMGYPTSSIDSANFQAVADQLYSEGFGISLMWNRAEKIKEFIRIVLSHVGGVLRVDRKTGLFTLKLIRSDYTLATLPQLTPNNSNLESWTRQAWGETANEITVEYTDATSGKAKIITVQDIANIDIQGAIINRKMNYTGITSDSLAKRVAMRDLQQSSTPLTKARLTVDRNAWNYTPGDVIRLTWPDYGIDAAYRILSINWGTLQESKITVDLGEDIFGLPQSSYSGQQSIGWTDPSTLPVASPTRYITETPYYDLARYLSSSDLAYLDATDCRIDVYAKRATSDTLGYNLWTGTAALTIAERGSAPCTPTAKLTVALAQEESSTLSCDDLSELDYDPPAIGSYIIVDGEYMRLDAYDTTAKTLTVKRGVLDTVPAVHSVDAIVWFASDNAGEDFIDYLTSDNVYVKCQTKTNRGTLALASTPQDVYNILQRQNRPYPPGQLRINAATYPIYISGGLTVSWVGRNRLTQTASIIDQATGTITPETGTTWEAYFYDETNTLKKSVTGIAIGTLTYAWATEAADCGGTIRPRIRVVLRSKRDTLNSWQSHDFSFDRAGYGLNYGLYYGAGV